MARTGLKDRLVNAALVVPFIVCVGLASQARPELVATIALVVVALLCLAALAVRLADQRLGEEPPPQDPDELISGLREAEATDRKRRLERDWHYRDRVDAVLAALRQSRPDAVQAALTVVFEYVHEELEDSIERLREDPADKGDANG